MMSGGRSAVVIALVAACALVACTKPNPAVCCTSEADCAAVGISDSERPCSVSGLSCVDHTCTVPAVPPDGPGPQCRVDMDCTGTTPYCAPDLTCVGCVESTQCPSSAPTCD